MLSYHPNASTHGPATIDCSSPATAREGQAVFFNLPLAHEPG